MSDDKALQYFSGESGLENWVTWLSGEPEDTWLEMCLNLAKHLAELTPEGRKETLTFIRPAVDENPETGFVMALGVLVGYMYSQGDVILDSDSNTKSVDSKEY